MAAVDLTCHPTTTRQLTFSYVGLVSRPSWTPAIPVGGFAIPISGGERREDGRVTKDFARSAQELHVTFVYHCDARRVTTNIFAIRAATVDVILAARCHKRTFYLASQSGPICRRQTTFSFLFKFL